MGAVCPTARVCRGHVARTIAAATGSRPLAAAPLSGGCIAEVYKVALADGGACVAKLAPPGAGALALEGWMLHYLRTHGDLPTPAVLHAEDELLVIEFIENTGAPGGEAQHHAADLLAALHGVTAPRFGLERDTLIGPLPQPNPQTERWLDFFREQRLLAMGRRALDAGRLPSASFARLERLCGRLERYIDEPPAASLIHGDLWGGNVLVRGECIAGFIDPALYYADPEIELAFSTLFNTFGEAFFARYREHRPLAPGFFELRRDLYNLYPLLVHSVLFGAHYTGAVNSILARYA